MTEIDLTHFEILKPATVLAIWSLLILLSLPIRRAQAVMKEKISTSEFDFGDGPNVPASARTTNRNISNLFELPVLFYVLALALSLVGLGADKGFMTLSWVYVGLRIAHSIIHVTYNKLLHRGLMFAASMFVLVALWIKFALILF